MSELSNQDAECLVLICLMMIASLMICCRNFPSNHHHQKKDQMCHLQREKAKQVSETKQTTQIHFKENLSFHINLVPSVQITLED